MGKLLSLQQVVQLEDGNNQELLGKFVTMGEIFIERQAIQLIFDAEDSGRLSYTDYSTLMGKFLGCS